MSNTPKKTKPDAKDEHNPFLLLPGETMIDVVLVKGNHVMVLQMTYRDAYYYKPEPGAIKRHFQIGVHAYTPTHSPDGKKILQKDKK